jgi:hypothetical protein
MGALEVLAGMVVLAGGLWMAAQAMSWWWSRDEKRTAALAAQAERLGMDFVATDALHVTWEPFPLFGLGARREATNIVHGTWGGVAMRAFDYSFEQPSDGSSAPVAPRRRLTCAVAEIDASCPRIVIGPTTLSSRLGEVVGATEIRLESEAFNERFRVECSDRRFATALMDQRMMAWLLASPAGVAYELREDRMLCVSERLSPASIPMLLEAVRGFHDRIPRVVASLYPPRPMGPRPRGAWATGGSPRRRASREPRPRRLGIRPVSR